MDWIRRNWPDLIIGFALLAVIAGIIATLLSGGSFFGNPNSSVEPPTLSTPQVSETPASSDPTAATPSVDSEAPPPGPPVLPVEETEVTGETLSSAAEQAEVTALSPEGSDGAETVTPLVPGTSETAGAEGTTVLETPTTETDAQTDLQNGAASALFSESPYRISVGSYRDAANAERRAESFRAAGYPVFIGEQDDLSIVLVGPYDERSEAEAAVTSIVSDGLEAAPLLFELADNPDERADIVETTASTAAETAGSTGADTTVQTQVTPPTNLAQGSYLQAGAYDTSEGARPQRERLESFGFNVAEVQEGSFVKLLVGPFSDEDLSSAQARLNEQGVDHFVRTF